MLSFKALGLTLARPFGCSSQSSLCLRLGALKALALLLLSAVPSVRAEPVTGKLASAQDGNPNITLVASSDRFSKYSYKNFRSLK